MVSTIVQMYCDIYSRIYTSNDIHPVNIETGCGVVVVMIPWWSIQMTLLGSIQPHDQMVVHNTLVIVDEYTSVLAFHPFFLYKIINPTIHL